MMYYYQLFMTEKNKIKNDEWKVKKIFRVIMGGGWQQIFMLRHMLDIIFLHLLQIFKCILKIKR